MNRIFLGLVLLLSLFWLGYVSLDILSETNNFAPEYLFCEKDEKVLVINRPQEVNLDALPDFANAPMAETYRNFSHRPATTIYISANQAQMLLVRSSNWIEEDILDLFAQHSSGKVKMDGQEFSIGELKGRFYKRNLYLSQGTITHNTGKRVKFNFDSKASASILHLNGSSSVRSVTDIYFRGNERVDYITYNEQLEQGKQVKDEEVFSHILTRNFSEYHFRERDFYAGEDSIFAAGPMFGWMQSGFVEIQYEGSTALISDYIDGQDPILILNELNQSQDAVQFDIPLTRTFPSPGGKYVIKYLEDLVVISQDEAICDKILADFKLGNTIALNKGARFQLYGALPGSVSERILTRNKAYTRAVYRGRLLETHMGEYVTATEDKVKKESLALNCGFPIADFAVLPQSGNLVVLGEQGEVARFRDGKLQWSKRLNAETVGEVQLIDLHQTGELFVLVTTRKEIHLWNLQGEAVNGFPIILDEKASFQTRFYRWNDRSYFLQCTEDNQLTQFDAKGGELHMMPLNVAPSRPLDVWASNGTLFVGVASASQFAMIDIDHRKIYREFALPGNCHSYKIPNELLQYGLEGGTLYKLSQKGVRSNFQSFPQASLLRLQAEGQNKVLVVKSNNTLHLLNPEGIPFCTINLPFNEVEDVFVQTFDSGKTLTAVIDGLENNVYLYALDGSKIKHVPMEGQTKVHLGSLGSQTMVTTVVDQFVVQYFD
jgi:hypothetical protein